jgi:uncharacterized membrane protein YqjE
MFSAVRRLIHHAATLLLSRAELAGVELAAARARLLRWILLLLVCVALLALAASMAALAFVAAFWDSLGWRAALVPLALFAAAGVAVLVGLRREIAAAPAPLSLTLAELARDREALQGAIEGDAAEAASVRR